MLGIKEKKLQLFIQSKEKAYAKRFKEYWYDKVLEENEDISSYVPNILKEDFQKYLGKKSGKRYNYIMFTINFKESVTFAQAYKKFVKYTKKTWIHSHYSCFEWRSLESGMHIHSKVVLTDDKVKVYRCKSEVYNTFKNLVGNKLHINVRYSNREGCFDSYIDGLKKEIRKDCYEVTHIMRAKHSIPNVFTNRAPLGEARA